MDALSAAVELPHSVGPYLGLMVAGFAVAIWGKGMHSTWTTAVGIIMIFLACLLLPLALHVFSDDPVPQDSRDFQTPAPLQPSP